jgi:hypothetical protein
VGAVDNLAITLLCLCGAAICLGLAIWVLRREQPILEPVPIVVSTDPKTEFIPREELLAAAQRRAQFPEQVLTATPTPNKADTTQTLLQTQVLVAARSRAHAATGTEFIPREPLLARQRSLSPTLEPKHAVEPPLPASPAKPAPTGLSVDELEPQLLAAERAFTRWARARESSTLEQLAESYEPALRQAIGVVAAASTDASDALLGPTLSRSEVSVHRRQVVALVSLLRNEVQALRRIEQCMAEQNVAEQSLGPTFREALSLWRGRETDWHLREQARLAHDTRKFWLDLLEDRRIDPGPDLLRELLASDDPELVVRGLQLAKYHDDPQARSQAAQSHLTNMRHPAQRMAAVELALFDRQPAAWMFCRQMANAPEYPRATELIASLGTARELDPLLRRLDRAHGDGLWLLCRSGRKSAAALAARRLQDTRGDELAATALRYVIGNPPGGARSAEALLEHWAECAPNLAAAHRYLYGEPIGFTDSVRRCLTSRDDRHHRAFGDELFFRSNGKIRWPGRSFAHDTLAAVAALRTHTINFEIGLGPG